MKSFYTIATLLCTFTVSLPASAATVRMQGMGNMPMGGRVASHTAGTPGTVNHYMAHGRINRVNETTGDVNITHGPIKILHWPGMTMSFPVLNKAALSDLRPGEAVDFDLAKGADGQYAITRIVPEK